jgi:hypothetical protein
MFIGPGAPVILPPATAPVRLERAGLVEITWSANVTSYHTISSKVWGTPAILMRGSLEDAVGGAQRLLGTHERLNPSDARLAVSLVQGRGQLWYAWVTDASKQVVRAIDQSGAPGAGITGARLRPAAANVGALVTSMGALVRPAATRP